MKKSDLILHPVRLQILSILAGAALSTQEIADRLTNIPVSTLYRQIRVLLEQEMIEVVETRMIKGTPEKIYTLHQSPRLSLEDMQNLSADQHIQYFLQYMLSVLDGFSRYVQQPGEHNFIADFTGYTESTFYATPDELREFGKTLNQALLVLSKNRPSPERHHHKLSIITYPISKENQP